MQFAVNVLIPFRSGLSSDDSAKQSRCRKCLNPLQIGSQFGQRKSSCTTSMHRLNPLQIGSQFGRSFPMNKFDNLRLNPLQIGSQFGHPKADWPVAIDRS